jgi:anaerobic selenocysteine-containing dehydrogenase
VRLTIQSDLSANLKYPPLRRRRRRGDEKFYVNDFDETADDFYNNIRMITMVINMTKC